MSDDIPQKQINLIVRIPITGIVRMPIVGIISECSGELQWDDVYSTLVNYIKYASKQVSGQYGGSVISSSEDLFQEGQLLLYHCFTLYKEKPMNQFSALFKASLWRKLRDIAGREKKRGFDRIDIEDAYDIGYSEDVVANSYAEYKLPQAAEMLESSPIALTILKEFVNPSVRTLWEASMDIARKQMLKEQEQSVAVPKSMTVRGIHIQRALEIPKPQFNQGFRQVKEVVSSIFLEKQIDVCDEEVECILQVAM